MTTDEPQQIVALVSHARDVPVVERERYLARLRDESPRTSVVLATCHRVEAYLVSSSDSQPAGAWLPAGGQRLVGDAAIRHAITVAVGRDSVVVGEDQILHQLRETIRQARSDGGLHPVLGRLFTLGLRAGRLARSWRGGPGRSLADVALSLIEQRSGPLARREVLVVGAGKMGRLAARAADAAGASVSVGNRSPRRASAIAAELAGQTTAFDPGIASDRFAAIIVAIGGPWAISAETAESLVASPALVVDLSVPAAVPARLAEQLGPRLLSVDDLARAEADAVLETDQTIVRLDTLIAATTDEFRSWLDARDGRATAAALADRAERERDSELDALWRRLPDLDGVTRDEIDRMSRHLARRLLREPLERLGRDSDGRHERAARELFGL